MNYIKSNINLDLAHKASPTTIHTVQLDSNTRIISASLFDNGQKWIPWEGATICLSYQKPDGTSGFYSELENGEVAATITDNTISIKLADQVLTVAGIVNASIVFIDDIYKRISTPVFQISVEKSTSFQQLPSNDYYAVRSIAELNEIVAASLQEVSDSVSLANIAMNDAIAATNRMNQTTQEILTAKQAGEFKGDKGDKGDKGEKGDPYGNIPLVRFDLTRNMLDVSEDMVLPDGTPWNFKRNHINADHAPDAMTTMDQIYSLFDELAGKYEKLWKKENAAKYVDEAPPSYVTEGVKNGKNLFVLDRVFSNCLVTDESGKTLIQMTNTAPYYDFMVNRSGQSLRIPENELDNLIWLPKGKYTLSYQVVEAGSKGALIRPFYLKWTDSNDSGYGSSTFNSDTYTEAEKQPSETRVVKTFEVTEAMCKDKDGKDCGGVYVSLRRTSQETLTICDVQIEAGEKTETVYEPYGNCAYKYKVVNGACVEKLPADATGDDLVGYYQKPAPAYTTWMYTFKFENKSMLAAEGFPCQKKKLLIISGLHGDERAAPFTAYLFAKRLCELFNEKTADGEYYYDDDYFKFAQAFDVYFIPCVNGYGMYQNTRWNANGVNLNRNFNSGHRSVPQTADGISPLPGNMNYPGFVITDAQGNITGFEDEWETKIVCAVTNSIKPDIACDLHNYPSAPKAQFYTGIGRSEWTPLMYQSATDCSIAFKRKYPQYFGTNINLVREAGEAALSAGANDGGSTCWWRLIGGVYFPVTIEISHHINYIAEVLGEDADGKPIYGASSFTESGADLFGATTFSVGEYTLRNQLMRYGQFVLENKPEG